MSAGGFNNAFRLRSGFLKIISRKYVSIDVPTSKPNSAKADLAELFCALAPPRSAPV